MATPIIQLEQVGKTFVSEALETHALEGIDLEVYPGEYLSVEGPSGSGKSTLLSILGLLEPPTTGRYLLAGEPVSTLSAGARAALRNRNIGFVFQSFHLIGDLTVRENVELPLGYRGMPARERRARAEAALERVGLVERRNHLPAQLSGGQQQRVAVARAIAGEPMLLLADEPTGNLDSRNGNLIAELLRQLNRQGTTLCLVTHNPDYARHASRRIGLLDGRLVTESRLSA
jgi:putative ABC transport system ATP-binding protein